MNLNLSELKNRYRSPETPGSLFISFEGIEGSGKTTQIKKLQSALEAQGLVVTVLREPGGTVFGEKLRAAILESQTPVHPLAECHLFLASRAQLLKEKVLPLLLTPGNVVILDRYMDSTLAYQGSARGLGYKTVLELHQHEPLSLMPHRTYFLDISLEVSMDRQSQRGQQKDYFESENLEFYSKLIQGYQDMAMLFSDRVLRIDGNRNQEEVHAEVLSDARRYLP